jgi:serine/threonine protein kinase
LREDNTHFTNEEIKSLMTSLAQTLIRIRRDINVVHRDLKPANILHCNGEWVLCDFGDSKIFTEYAPSNTIVGTPNFMSPQMFGLFQNPRA